MILCISDVLSPETVETIINLLQNAEFIEGKITEKMEAKKYKKRSRFQKNLKIYNQVKSLILETLHHHSLFNMTAHPKKISSLILSRYEVGMSPHIFENIRPIKTEHHLMKTDLCMTIFLSNPSTYKGGELVIESSQGTLFFKLESGSMILYPASHLHYLQPLTEGVRFAVMGWVHSIISDETQREILFDLENVKTSLSEKLGKNPGLDLLSKKISDLLKLWT